MYDNLLLWCLCGIASKIILFPYQSVSFNSLFTTKIPIYTISIWKQLQSEKILFSINIISKILLFLIMKSNTSKKEFVKKYLMKKELIRVKNAT